MTATAVNAATIKDGERGIVMLNAITVTDGNKALSMTFLVDNGIDLTKAIKDACAEYVSTDAGKKIIKETNGRFNWFDFVKYVPQHICRKHGFEKYESSYSHIIGNADEQLCDIPQHNNAYRKKAGTGKL